MRTPPGLSAATFESAITQFKKAVGESWVYTAEQDTRLYRDAYSPFLGEPEAPTAIGPARLALRAGAAVLVATAAPAPGFDLQVSVSRLTVDGLKIGTAGETELTRRINAELGARIAALPTMWPWLHRRGGGPAPRTNPHLQPIRVSKLG